CDQSLRKMARMAHRGLRVLRPAPFARRQTLTTVASWELNENGPVVHGVAYRGKSAEFERFVDLPTRSALPLELAMSGRIPKDWFRSHGWHVRDAYDISHDPWVYRGYLAQSFAEWSV